ncbi:MAG TPA: metallophosphoesterase [Amaricoccus sp.]|nr:metallophosphoesterase [Amaricoccus sp.]
MEPVAVLADPHFHDIDYRQGAGRGPGVAFRTLADTAESTRVFNESFVAMPALLDDIVARGIRIAVLLGDLTDDGQASTMRAAVALLDRYRERHGLRVFATPGNHDLYAIHGRHQSKRFLNPDGGHTLVTSDPAAGQGASVARIVDAEMYCGGYGSALAAMADFGFFRRPDHLHWECPFGDDDRLAARTFRVRSADGGTSRRMIDASYLVEPAAGLWLLSIDANVFEPRDGDGDPEAEASYIDSTDAGWNAMLRHKPFVVGWMADVARRAQAAGKRLLAFSHYPALDPLGGAHADEVALFGETGHVRRAPAEAVAAALAGAGVGVHFSGHLHVNATSSWRRDGDFLVNVAVPSTVAFPSGYKIATFEGGELAVETVALDSVPGHDRAFAAYRAEIGRAGPSHAGLVEASSLGDFLNRHISELAASRYLPREWPARIAAIAQNLDLADLGAMAGVEVEPLPFATLLSDWYRLRKGGELALPAIPAERLRAYATLGQAFAARAWPEGSLEAWFAGFFRMLRAYLEAPPSRDFRIDLATGAILREAAYRGRTERRHTGSA